MIVLARAARARVSPAAVSRLDRTVRVGRGEPHPAYGTGLFLVRPDGCVGWAGDTPAGLGAHLARFGRS